MIKLDLKFHGTIIKNKDGTVVPDDQWVCFLAKDNAFPSTLLFYLEKCKELGAGAEQIASVEKLIEKVQTWRAANPELCKVPDVHPGEIKER